MNKAKSSFNIEKGYEDESLCVCSGALKNRWGQGEGVKAGSRTKGLITWAGLARFTEIPAP